tara:strand:+ start:305 stop:532 length:228 start_codon:yes stop_codon:yes gene_type:complete
MKFILESVAMTDRHTEPRLEDIPMGISMPAKHEEITMTVKIVGSGDTREFTTQGVLMAVMSKLSIIEPKENSDER